MICKSRLVAILATLSISLSIQGQNGNNETHDFEDLEEVIVIGSRVGLEKSAEDLPVPIDVYSAFELEKAGEIDLNASIAKLAPSFNFSRQSAGDGATYNAASLRGLAPDQTLVLINGKRRHSMAWLRILDGVIGYGTGGTDLRSIPTAAIANIEVLRDGAAAQYGSDAIAGVINLRLKETNGGLVQIHSGRTDADGSINHASFNGGLEISGGGFLNVSSDWHDNDSLARNGGNGGLDPNYQDQLITASSPSQNGTSFFVNSALPIGESSELYAFGGTANRESIVSGAYRFKYNYWEGVSTGDETWDFVLPNFINFHERNTHPVYPNGFLPNEQAEISDVSFVVGLIHPIRGWNLDLSIGYGQSTFDFGVSNSINASIGAQYLQSNPNASIQEIIANAGPRHGKSGGIEFSQTSLNLDLQNQLDGSILTGIAYGFEYRRENYQQSAGDIASWSCGSPHNPAFNAFAVGLDGSPLDGVVAACGFQGYPGYSPRNARLSNDSRNNQAAYFELEGDLSQQTQLGLAARAEDYSDAGFYATGKFTLRQRISDSFALRGALSTGFRAPSLSQRRFNSIVFVGSETGLSTVFSANEGHPIARTFGVHALDHESSQNASFGFVWYPDELEMRVSIDGYRTNIDDRIVRSQGLDCTGITACEAENVSSVAFFLNAIDTNTQGMDLTVERSIALTSSQLNLEFDLHLNKTEIVGEKLPAQAPEGLNFASYFGGWAAELLENGQPRRKARFALDWQKNNWSNSLQLTHYGETTQQPFDTGAITIEPEQVVDIRSQITLDRVAFTIGVNNVLDRLPTELPKTHLANVLWGVKYPNDTPFGLQGRYVYFGASYRFD